MEITAEKSIREKHVAVFAFPFTSHPRLLLTLVQRLAVAAPMVVFSFFCTKKFNQLLFVDRSWNNILPYDVSDGMQLEDNVSEVMSLEERVNKFLVVAEEELRRGVRVAEMDIGLKISCLMTDAFFWFCGDIAKEMNIPWVAVFNGSPYALATHLYTDLIREKTNAQLLGIHTTTNI